MELSVVMTFDTHLLDAALLRRAKNLEHERQIMLARIATMLEQLGAQYGIDRAWIFGSVTRPNRFTQRSDVDIAVETLNPDDLFDAISAFSNYLARDVDLVVLSKCHFAHRIRTEGLLWTKAPTLSYASI